MVLTDEQWAALEPLVEAARPKGKTRPRDLRRTLGAIVWRHRNGATWRAIPAELGPWWRAAQLFVRWAELGAWQRLLETAQGGGGELGTAFLDRSSIRAHPKAAGAPKKGDRRPARPAGGAGAVARGLRHEGVRRRGRAGPRGSLRAGPGAGARAAAGAGAPRPAPARAAVGRGRPRLQPGRPPPPP